MSYEEEREKVIYPLPNKNILNLCSSQMIAAFKQTVTLHKVGTKSNEFIYC